MTQIKRHLPQDSYFAAHPSNANAPTALNPFATIADLSGFVSSNIYTSDGAISGNRNVSLAGFTLDFTGGTTRRSFTSGTDSVFSGTGQNPIGFSLFGDLNYVTTSGVDGYSGLHSQANNAVYIAEVYDALGERAGYFSGAFAPAGGTVYSSLYYTPDSVSFTGLEANFDGEQLYSQLTNSSTALAGTELMMFVSSTGYLRGATLADLTTHVSDGNGIFDIANDGGTIPVAFDTNMAGAWNINMLNGQAFNLRNIVAGNATLIVQSDATANGQAIIKIDARGGSRDAYIHWAHIGTNYWTMGLDSSDGHKLKIGQAAITAGTIMTFNGNSVGIGTTAPNTSTKLDIRGIGNTSTTWALRVTPSITTNITLAADNAGFVSVGALSLGQSIFEVTGDIETIGSTEGLIVEDRTNTNRYRIYTDGGAIQVELA